MSLPREFVFELHKHFTGDIRTDTASRILYSTDASIYRIEPTGVLLPRTQEDLIAAVELAAKYEVAILPRGSGTSLAGQAIGRALILDFSRWLNRIIEIDPVSHSATVEPGTVLSALNLAASKHGLMFGPDPASAERATMGGIIGNNATGAHSILYGMSADHLISADVLLGDGTAETWDANCRSKMEPVLRVIRENYGSAIQQTQPKAWRNSAGYRLNYLLPWSPSAPPQWDSANYGMASSIYSQQPVVNLAALLAGSEGTLAVMRRLKVNLVPKPNHTILGVLSYNSIAEACDDVPRLLRLKPSAIELVPRLILELARTIPGYARQMDWLKDSPEAILIVEFSDDSHLHLRKSAESIGDEVTIAETREQQNQIWAIRKVGLGIMDSRPQSERPIAFIEDCAIPVDQLGLFVREVERILSAHGTYGGIYAHASGGCLHIRPILDMKTGEGARSMRSIAEATLELTLKLGGSMSSEHGDGIARGEWLQKTFGDEIKKASRLLKTAADPHNILNPNKMFDAPKMDSNLRYDLAYRTKTWTPALDFSPNGNLVTAIEQCNGQGVCRKDAGLMCPSFQATRDEMHSTRGRANLLRALISNPGSMENDESELKTAVAHALDLCLACKGCKFECPSGVDMAKLKYEFEHQYYKTHRRPLRDYLFGYFHVVAKYASLSAPLFNALTRNRVFKRLVSNTFEITDRRPFPRFTRVKTQTGRVVSPTAKKIVFLSDPFARYIEPQVEQSAFNILHACGYDVHVLPIIGAGASLLSKGLLDGAKRHARKMLEALKQIDPTREAAIVGIEPPEIYTLKHDYVDLLPDRADEIASYASRTWLLDEYLLRSERFALLRNKKIKKQIGRRQKTLFHPHCHQRAERPADDGLPFGANATADLLDACGYDTEMIDAGCCGMAGTFGYEAEHYDLSMKVGELKLLPYLRQYAVTDERQVIVSTGAACRMQIRQGVSAEPIHSIQLVEKFLFDEASDVKE